MKIIITERQYDLLQKKEEILKIPFNVFNYDWDKLQNFLKRKGNPPYELIGSLKLNNTPNESLGNLSSIGGNLNLFNSSIKSIGNLSSVGGYLDLRDTSIESLGNLQSVGGDLNLFNTPLSSKYSEKEIRQMVNVGGEIYL